MSYCGECTGRMDVKGDCHLIFCGLDAGDEHLPTEPMSRCAARGDS